LYATGSLAAQSLPIHFKVLLILYTKLRIMQPLTGKKRNFLNIFCTSFAFFFVFHADCSLLAKRRRQTNQRRILCYV